MKNEYEINKGTLAVISMEDGKTKIYTINSSGVAKEGTYKKQ